MTQTILITGGTGAVGPRVVEALCAGGYHVRVLALDPPKPGAIPLDVEVRIGSITDPDTVRDAMQGCSGVIHLAALLHIMNPPVELRPKYEAINVGGTRCVIEAAQAAGVERVVFFSTIAVYGYAAPQNSATGNGRATILTETTPCQPDTFYGETKLAAEKIVLDAKRADGAPLGTVLRMSAIYGSGIKGNYRKLALALARGRFIPIGPGGNCRTLVYDRDAATAAVLALAHPAAAGQIYNVTDGCYHRLCEIIAAICGALGKHPPRVQIPVWAATFAAGSVESALRLVRKNPPALRATIGKYLEDVAVSGEKLRNDLGFVPKYELAEGWKECIAEMRKSGEVK